MKSLEIKLHIPLGYKIKEKKQITDLHTAHRLLSTRQQHRYTKAIRTGDTAELTRHVIRCPHCGKEVPAYPHCLHNNINAVHKSSELDAWAMLQMSLFDNDNSKLDLNQPIYSIEKYICKKCGCSSYHSDKTVELLVGYGDSYVYISREINNFKDISQMKWLPEITITNDFPLYERILFDFDTGITFIQLMKDNGDILYSLDITNSDKIPNCGILSSLISENKIVKRNLKRLFQQHWDTPILFATRELSLNEFILLARFVDYPRSFYDAIPYEENSDKIESSFMHIADKIHNSKKAVDLLKESKLPHSKSIRRLFFENPGMLFYLEECEILFGILKNVDLFCTVMKSDEVYLMLSMLHYYPGIVDFYTDYCKVKGAKSLCDHLSLDCLTINQHAIKYSVLNPSRRKIEQIKWKERNDYFEEDAYSPQFLIPFFSTPMRPVPEYIIDRTVNGFAFKCLRTKKDYQNAGTELSNCLKSWKLSDNPVVAIYTDNKMVAAMEIGHEKVYEALQAHNLPIDRETALFSAIKKWCRINCLDWLDEDE